jgi:mono/diheme cytochrome c family protein
MHRSTLVLLLGFSLLMPAAAVALAPEKAPAFDKDVLPILTTNCLSCHGASAQLGDLDLRTPSAMLKGGSKGPALERGFPGKSLLLKRVLDGSMPPGNARKLTKEETAKLGDWIRAGAPGEAAKADPRDHWAFQPVKRPALPPVRNRAWVRNPIDQFILARLEAKGIPAPPAADRRTLLRRAYLDLIGLPPTPEEQAAFLADRSSNAWDKVVDGLLARPEYGERWGRHWLDVARYAESNGYERDGAKPQAWRYRDYVIQSLNADKPYNRFLTEQLAGDEVPGSSAETQIATTFLRLGTWDDEPADPAVDRYDQLDDILGTASTAFMGLTLRCARCHDHKFEPFSQKEYHQVLALFEPLKRPQEGRTELDRFVGTAEELKEYRLGMARADGEIAPLQEELDKLQSTVQERLFALGKTSLPADAVAAFRVEPEKRNAAQKNLVTKHGAKLKEEILAIAAPEERTRLESLEKRIGEIDAQRPPEPLRAYVMYEEGPKPPVSRLLVRGNPAAPAEEVGPGLPAVLVKGPLPPPQPTALTTGRRLWLARWLTRPDNPLTARVMVNRVWQGHFGEGLVQTESDFGVMGQRPTNPALLDWLAAWFTTPAASPASSGRVGERGRGSAAPRGAGWSLKRLHRLIVTSNAYNAASVWTPAIAKGDPDGLLHARWRPRRLEAEAVRDSILAVTGQLNPQREGPSVYPTIPRAVLEGQSRPGEGWGKSDERQASRRSVYIFSKRSLGVPELELLDGPDTTSSCEQRPVSTIAPQALTFLNGEWINTQARYFAARLAREAGDDPRKQVERAFALTVCRPPTAAELEAALQFLQAQEAQIAADRKAAGKPAGDPRRSALESFCLVALNSNDFAYLR